MGDDAECLILLEPSVYKKNYLESNFTKAIFNIGLLSQHLPVKIPMYLLGN